MVLLSHPFPVKFSYSKPTKTEQRLWQDCQGCYENHERKRDYLNGNRRNFEMKLQEKGDGDPRRRNLRRGQGSHRS